MKNLGFLVVGSLAATAVSAENVPSGKPNVLVILADDMGYSDLGCYGGEIRTPNLDRLAADGIRFTRFYNSARCCPSRASLLTGLYPHQAGMGAMENASAPIPAYQGYLNDQCVTLGDVMGSAGYRTFLSGKWHLGKKEKTNWPCGRGFQESFSFLSGACSYYDASWPGNKVPEPVVVGDKLYPLPENFFMTDAITDFALQFIGGTPADVPVFGYIAYTAPHWPLHERPENIAKYKGRYDAGWDVIRKQRYEKQRELGIVDQRYEPALRSDGGTLVPAWDSLSDEQKADMAGRMEVYAAQVDALDQQIGRLITKLKETGRYENTLILFLSDNGACAEPTDQPFGKKWINPDAPMGSKASFASYGRGWAEVSNVPFRYWKQTIYEGGVCTPLIAHWPAGITAAKNSFNRQPGHIVDIMATCLEVAGAQYPESFNGRKIIPAEGISFAPVFKGRSRTEHDCLAWEHFANRGVLSGTWKMVAQAGSSPVGMKPGKWELYNMEEDPAEKHDLAQKYPEKVQELGRKYQQWADRIGVIENLRDWQKR